MKRRRRGKRRESKTRRERRERAGEWEMEVRFAFLLKGELPNKSESCFGQKGAAFFYLRHSPDHRSPKELSILRDFLRSLEPKKQSHNFDRGKEEEEEDVF